MSYVDEIKERVAQQNLAQPEFQQAVEEVLESLRPVIEANEDFYRREALLERLLGPYAGKLDAVVLGCTHFPFAKDAIRAVLGRDIPLFDGALGTARELARRLAEQFSDRFSGENIRIRNLLD